MPAQKAARPRKEWYSISVETLRGLGLLALLLTVLGGGYVALRVWDGRATQKEAQGVLSEVQALFPRLQNEPRAANGFKTEIAAAWQSFQDGQVAYARRDYRAALDHGRRSRNVLLSVLDSLSLPTSSVGQAQFISIQGDVEFRRGESGDWEEARSRVALHQGDYVRTSEKGSAEIMFLDGTLYTVRPNTQFMVMAGGRSAGSGEQSIQMEYGWVDLNTAQGESNVKTPGAVARVRQDSEAFVAVDKGSSQGRFGAFSGGIELSSQGGLKREIQPMQQVVQTGDLLSDPVPLPGKPELQEPADNADVNLETSDRLVLSWEGVPNAARYALQVSRNHLFVDNVIDVSNRTKTRATLGVRGEGTFQWRVAAYGKDGVQGPWSKASKFRVASFRSADGNSDKTPPDLELEDVKSYGNIFIVVGRTEPGSRVEINGEQVKTAADGAFNKTVQLAKEGWSFIEVRARDGAGNETLRRHRVFVENP